MFRTSVLIWILASWVLGGSTGWSASPGDSTKTNAPAKPKPKPDASFWSFRPLNTSAPPALTHRRSSTPVHPVDAFIDAALESRGLHPSPQADRRTRIRRAALDLTGMPPTHEQVEAFEHNSQPDAWSRVVDQFLASPQYGERWARHWLDVVRFAESSGFEHDYDRPNAYHYRDFVIRAFNSDMPYDQFVRWQLAGDEFAPDSPEALMATGFLGAGVFPTQITANEVERVRYDALDDMLSTVGNSMLGLTIGCARCHDHKFDPISTDDYYRMLATFTTTVRSDVPLDLHPEENRERRQRYETEHAPLVDALTDYEKRELPKHFESWLAEGAPVAKAASWQVLSADSLTSKGGARFKTLEDGSYLAEGPNAEFDVYRFVTRLEPQPHALTALRLEALSDPTMVRGGPGRAENGNIGLSRIRVFIIDSKNASTNEIHLVRPQATFQQNSNSLAISAALDDQPKTGWAIDPQFGTNHAALFEFSPAISVSNPGVSLEVRLEFDLNLRHNIGRPRIAVTTSDNPSLGAPALPAQIANLLAECHTAFTNGQKISLATDRAATLMQWWKPQDAGWAERQRKVQDHASKEPKPNLTTVLVCAEGYTPVRMHTQGADFFPETYYLSRGSTDNKRGVAPPGFLPVLMRRADAPQAYQWKPPSGARYSGRRRGFANWITDTENGAGALLARVIVNRLWQHHFGQGLVATPNDFGAQGSTPSHPELLDWLAGELIRGGWRLKPIQHLILTSEAYQRSVREAPEVAAKDPNNVWLSRWVPHRLEAESIRDSLLFISGALDPKMYGPGTLDDASVRRSIYFTVKRSQLIPSMQCFDAPEPLVSQGMRPTTTVAPQALWLLNGKSVRQWAQKFAHRIAPQNDTPWPIAIREAYQIALNRKPTEKESRTAAKFLEAQANRYQQSGQSLPRLSALTDFAQAMMGLNELIYVQ